MRGAAFGPAQKRDIILTLFRTIVGRVWSQQKRRGENRVLTRVDEEIEVVLPQGTEVESDEITIEFLQEQINGLLIVKEVTDDLETLQLIDEQINGLNIIIDLKNQEND